MSGKTTDTPAETMTEPTYTPYVNPLAPADTPTEPTIEPQGTPTERRQPERPAEPAKKAS